MALNLFPFTNLHNLNTDWILKVIKECKEAVDESLTAVRAALENAVLYTNQSKDVTSRRTATRNIHAVSYDSFPLTPGEADQARNNIRAAAISDIPDVSDVLRYSSQSLTTDQKAQARTNIGALSSSDIPAPEGVVSYAESQDLTSTQQATARTNIGALGAGDIPTPEGVVSYAESQSLTDTEKTTARTNIGAAASSAIPDVSDVLRYSSQSLTSSQQEQARANIGASVNGTILYSEAQRLTNLQKAQARANIDVDEKIFQVTVSYENSAYVASETLNDILGEFSGGRQIQILFIPQNSTQVYFTNPIVDDTYESIQASIILPADPSYLGNTTGWVISITNDGTDDVVSVTAVEGRLVPVNSMPDIGKALLVGSNGRPSWETIKPVEVNDLVSSSVTLANAADNTIYTYGELTALTVTAITTPGDFIIRFTSGATPTTTNFPATMIFPEAFTAEAKTRYEINVSNGYALVTGWPIA